MPNREINKGDLLIGLPSTGLHTNGYSLARKVLLEHYDCSDYVNSIDATIGEELLSIHKSYLPILDKILHKDWLVGISHITGGGIVENTRRVLSEGQDISIDWDAWTRPEIFNLIQNLGSVPEDDMRHSMNLGIGLILIIKSDFISDIASHLNSIKEPFFEIGIVK